MEDTPSSRRATAKLGDATFSVGAIVLGCGLLVAAAAHLFGPTADGIPQPIVAHTGQVAARAVATTLAVPLASNVTVTPAFVRRSAPVLTARPPEHRARQSAQVVQPPRGHDAPHAPQTLRAPHASTALRASHGNSGSMLSHESGHAEVLRKLVVASAHRPASRVAIVPRRSPRRAAPANRGVVAHGARPAPAGHTVRIARAMRAAGSTPPARAARATGVARMASASTRTRSLAQTPRSANPARAKRLRAIIEPPLGYEAQPALVVAPAAAALDLGVAAFPSIRARRHR